MYHICTDGIFDFLFHAHWTTKTFHSITHFLFLVVFLFRSVSFQVLNCPFVFIWMWFDFVLCVTLPFFCLIYLFVLFRYVWSGTKTPLWRQKDSLLLILFRFIRKYFARVGLFSFLFRSHFTFIDRIRRERSFSFFHWHSQLATMIRSWALFFLSYTKCVLWFRLAIVQKYDFQHTHKEKPTTRMKELD